MCGQHPANFDASVQHNKMHSIARHGSGYGYYMTHSTRNGDASIFIHLTLVCVRQINMLGVSCKKNFMRTM